MRLNYEVENMGDKPWMVLIHGAGGNIKTWKYQRSLFREHFNLLLIDLRDHGDSVQANFSTQPYSFELIARDVIALLDELRIEKAHFMALSMGSLVIQKLSELRPEMIEKAVIAGGIFNVSKLIIWFAYSANFLSYVIPFRWSYWIFSWLIMPKQNHQKARNIFIQQARKLTPSAYRRWIGLYREFSSMVKNFNKESLPYPLLAVMGSEDYVFLDSARSFAESRTNVHLQIIPDCGHICNIEKADEFNQRSLNWLQSR